MCLVTRSRFRADTIAAVRAATDPLSRAKLAHQFITESQQFELELTRLRREAVEEAAASGLSFSAIADELKLSKGRVSQITGPSGPSRERIMFGIGPVSVAIPLRPVPDRALPVIASEDAQAREELVSLLTKLKFVIQPDDNIDPRRAWRPWAPDLVAICGPKSSPTIAKLYDGDPVLKFTIDDAGRWGIDDLDAAARYESPMDDPEPQMTDIAYVGRLPFDKDRNLFLIGGVHAIGSRGAVHYLTHNLATLYDKVGADPFSIVIASDHDAEGKIVRSEALCPPALH